MCTLGTKKIINILNASRKVDIDLSVLRGWNIGSQLNKSKKDIIFGRSYLDKLKQEEDVGRGEKKSSLKERIKGGWKVSGGIAYSRARFTVVDLLVVSIRSKIERSENYLIGKTMKVISFWNINRLGVCRIIIAKFICIIRPRHVRNIEDNEQIMNKQKEQFRINLSIVARWKVWKSMGHCGENRHHLQ